MPHTPEAKPEPEPGLGRIEKQCIEFNEKGNMLLDYARHHLKDMIDGDYKIKNFTICSGMCWGLTQYIDDIRIKYNEELQSSLIQWIRTENATGTLFNSEYWKPFRDPCAIMYMSRIGYRRMFVYKQYYFQFAIRHTCECNDEEYEDVVGCLHVLGTYFGLAFYGWKDESYETPLATPDNMMSDYWWNLKQL